MGCFDRNSIGGTGGILGDGSSLLFFFLLLVILFSNCNHGIEITS
ncbi:MAG: hypothetical protein K0Q97_496 [Bacillota bacterium]|jgi:hypothetical protein|nr:hypothetical protein [Bacillota bacterium]